MNKDWKEPDSSTFDWERYTQDEIKARMKDMNGDNCLVCHGLIEHHSEDALRNHLRILSRWRSPKLHYAFFGVAAFVIGCSITGALLTWL